MRDDFLPKTKEALAKRVGYKCSNPNCRKPTIGPQIENLEGVVNIGVAAHITAAAPGGKRYNPNITSEQRRNITNGIWLCQNHAKIIDSDEERYPVELLIKWKQISEEATFYEVENKSAEELKEINKSINVTSINQQGGQTAHTIINQRPQRRALDESSKQLIIDELKKLPSESFHIWLANGDPEADFIAKQLKEVLISAGWEEKGFIYKLAGSYPEGIEIAIGQNLSPSQQTLADLLYRIGKLNISGKKYDDVTEVTIIVGPNPMNFI